MAAPSTPNNIAIIAAQAGQTQAARDPRSHDLPDQGRTRRSVLNDLDPAFGPYTEPSQAIRSRKAYATLRSRSTATRTRRRRRTRPGVERDLGALIALGRAPVPWGWYQEGYVSPQSALPGYEAHHNAPQYFGVPAQQRRLLEPRARLAPLLDGYRDGSLPSSASSTSRAVRATSSDGSRPIAIRTCRRTTSATTIIPARTTATIKSVKRSSRRSSTRSRTASTGTIRQFSSLGTIPADSTITFRRRSSNAVPTGTHAGTGGGCRSFSSHRSRAAAASCSDPGDTASVLKFAEAVFGVPSLASLPEERPVPSRRPARRQSCDYRPARRIRSRAARRIGAADSGRRRRNSRRRRQRVSARDELPFARDRSRSRCRTLPRRRRPDLRRGSRATRTIRRFSMPSLVAAPPVRVPVFSGFDYVTVDEARHRAFAAHTRADRLLIVDTLSGAVAGQVDVGPMHGLASGSANRRRVHRKRHRRIDFRRSTRQR